MTSLHFQHTQVLWPMLGEQELLFTLVGKLVTALPGRNTWLTHPPTHRVAATHGPVATTIASVATRAAADAHREAAQLATRALVWNYFSDKAQVYSSCAPHARSWQRTTFTMRGIEWACEATLELQFQSGSDC